MLSFDELRRVPPVDTRRIILQPEDFQDPIAIRAAWHPLSKRHATLFKRVLHRSGEDRAEFELSLWVLLLQAAACLAGAAIYFHERLESLFGVEWFDSQERFIAGITDAHCIGAVFFFVGAISLFLGTSPIVFDKRDGWFWRGRLTMLTEASPDGPGRRRARLNHVHAIQLLYEARRGSENEPVDVFEMNLVLDDARRVHVLAHNDGTQLRIDATKLSEFLGVPIWDMS